VVADEFCLILPPEALELAGDTGLAVNSLNNWLPTLYRTVYHLPLQAALRAASLTNVAQVALVLVCAYSIDRIGRRNWAVVAFCLGGVLLACLGLFGAQSVWGMLIVGTASYGLIGSIAAVLYLYTPEVYPTRMRATSLRRFVSGSCITTFSTLGIRSACFRWSRNSGSNATFFTRLLSLGVTWLMIDTR
jgi:MFS family permease